MTSTVIFISIALAFFGGVYIESRRHKKQVKDIIKSNREREESFRKMIGGGKYNGESGEYD